jgi:hypothetical protein
VVLIDIFNAISAQQKHLAWSSPATTLTSSVHPPLTVVIAMSQTGDNRC